MEFYSSDGSKSGKIGYGDRLEVNDRKPLAGTRKIRIGYRHGWLAQLTFHDEDDEVIAGGITSSGDW